MADWTTAAALLVGGFLVILSFGIPVAFGFLLVNMVGMYLFMGNEAGLLQLIRSVVAGVANFTFLPIPFFVLMGELLFHSGLALRALDGIDKLLGRLPGRLSVVAGLTGTLLAALSGSAIANVATLGSLLVPEMQRRGYHKSMILGPIMGAGGLGMLIPPSNMAVVLGSVGGISIAKVLIGGAVPGLLLALLYGAYVIGLCWWNPKLAPAYALTEKVTWQQQLRAVAVNIVPLFSLIFIVLGLIFVGVATPTEAAALGVLGAVLLSVAYRTFTVEVFLRSMRGTLMVSGMILLIIAGSAAYSQLLAFTGVSRALVQLATELPVAPVWLMVAMQVVILILGCFMEQTAIIMLTIPLFMPIIKALNFDPIWFAILTLINLQVAFLTPPFGMGLFTMKGVAPPDTTTWDLYKAVTPYIVMDLALMAVIIFFPEVVTWLPNLMPTGFTP